MMRPIFLNLRWLFPHLLVVFALSYAHCDVVESIHTVENSSCSAIWLTWQRDPHSTMTISWLIPENATYRSVPLFYRGKSDDPETWKQVAAEVKPLPESCGSSIGFVELINLHPNSEYEFRVGNQEEIWRFQTAPGSLDQPISFIVGGDTMEHDPRIFESTNRRAATYQPLFVLFGGDLAYAANSSSKGSENFARWQCWLSIWFETMRINTNKLIPLLVTIGNHEVKGGFGKTPKEAPFFYALFKMPGDQGYNALRFKDYLSLYLLDSGHTHPVYGQQSSWLESQLKADAHMLHRIAVYHVPAYPTVRSFNNEHSKSIRKHWVPHFDTYHLHLAFENHDHAYKRTFPLRDGKMHAEGVVYIGDGSWGVHPRTLRKVKNDDIFAVTRSERQFSLVTLSNSQRTVQAVGHNNIIIDSSMQQVEKVQ